MEQEIEVIREQEEQEIEIQNENITVDVVINNNYEELENLPQINNIELIGNLSSQDLGLQPVGNYVTDSNYIHTDNNFTNTYKNNVDLNTRDRHTHANKAVLDGISSSDITNWNNKSDFSGNYNDLSNKPTIPTKLSELESDSSHELVTSAEKTTWDNKSDFSGSYNDLTDKPTIPDVSNFITKDVNDLTYYTLSSNLATVATSGSYSDLSNKPDLSSYATTTSLGNETSARENADVGLQEQIDAITSSSDVKDIVGTYTELQNYDTTTLGNDDIIKVLQDNTHNNAMTYYRWVISSGFGEWEYIGQEGPYYTKGETDTLLNGKQNEITSSNKLSTDLISGLATVATSGSYNDLSNTPTIPAEVTETTVSNWGFTKNVGTITGITMNNTSMGTSGVVNLGTVITSHQDISGKLDTSKVKNSYSTTSGDVYDVTYINSTVGDIESLLAEV